MTSPKPVAGTSDSSTSPTPNPLINQENEEIQLQQAYDREQNQLQLPAEQAKRASLLKETTMRPNSRDSDSNTSSVMSSTLPVSGTSSTAIVGATSQSTTVAAEMNRPMENPLSSGGAMDEIYNVPRRLSSDFSTSTMEKRATVATDESPHVPPPSSPSDVSNEEEMKRQVVNRSAQDAAAAKVHDDVKVSYHVIDRSELLDQGVTGVLTEENDSDHIDTRPPREKYLNNDDASALLRHTRIEDEADDDAESRTLRQGLRRESYSTFFGEEKRFQKNSNGQLIPVANPLQDMAVSALPSNAKASETAFLPVQPVRIAEQSDVLREHPHEKKEVQTSTEELDQNVLGVSALDTKELEKQKHKLVGMNYQRVIVKRKDDSVQTNPPKLTVTMVPSKKVLQPEFPFDESNKVIDCKYSVLNSKVASVERERRAKHKTEAPIKDIKVRYEQIIPWEEEGLQKLASNLCSGRISLFYGHGHVKYLHMILDLLLMVQSASFSLFAVKDAVVYDLNYLCTQPLNYDTLPEECILDEVNGLPLDAVRASSMDDVEQIMEWIHILNAKHDAYQSVHLVAHLYTTSNEEEEDVRPRPDLYLVQLADSQRPLYLTRRPSLQVQFEAVHQQLTALGIVLNAVNTSRLRIPYHKSILTTMLKYPIDSMQYGIDMYVFLSSHTEQVFENMHILKYTKAVAQSGIGEIFSRTPAVDIDLLKHENTLLQSELKIAKRVLPSEYSVACSSLEKNKDNPVKDGRLRKIAIKVQNEIKKNVKKIAGVEADANKRFKAYKLDQDTFHNNRIEAMRADMKRIQDEIDAHTLIHEEKFTHLKEEDLSLSKEIEEMHSEMEQLTLEHQMLENSIAREEDDIHLLGKKLERLHQFNAQHEENQLEENDEATHNMRVQLAEHAKKVEVWNQEYLSDQYLLDSFYSKHADVNHDNRVWFSYQRKAEYEDQLLKILNRTILLKDQPFVQSLMDMTEEQLKEIQVRNFQLRQELKTEETRMLELQDMKKEQHEKLIEEGRSHAHTKLGEFIRWKQKTLMTFVHRGTYMSKVSESGKLKSKYLWVKLSNGIPTLCCCDVIDSTPIRDRPSQVINLRDDVVDIQLGQYTPRFQRYYRRLEVSNGKVKAKRRIPLIGKKRYKETGSFDPVHVARHSHDFARSFSIVYKKKKKTMDLIVAKGSYEFWLLALRDICGIVPTYTYPVPVQGIEDLTNDELECCSRNHISCKGMLEVKQTVEAREKYDTLIVVDVKQASNHINIIQAYHIFEDLYVPRSDVLTMVEPNERLKFSTEGGEDDEGNSS